MLPPTSALVALLTAVFAYITAVLAEGIPDGVMPKRQNGIAGTGASTRASASTSAAAPTSSSSTTPLPVTTTAPTSASKTPISQPSVVPVSVTTATSVAPSSTDSTPLPPAGGSSASPSKDSSVPSSKDGSSAAPSSSTVPTIVPVITPDSLGSTTASQMTTSTLAAVASSSGIVNTQTGSASDLVIVGSSTINRSTLSSATIITSALVAAETQSYTTTSFWTSNGQVFSSVITTDRVFFSTTGFATATISPSLDNGGGSSGSGLSTQSKSIIGGVVGGIGGAIVIGGLALVAWRLWGKKRRPIIENDEFLESRDDSIRLEKRTSQPFQNTLDQYHNPGGSVNTASNF